MEELEKLLENEDDLIRGTTQMVVALIEDVKNGELSKDELSELVEDLTTLEAIDDLANSIERKAKIAKAFETIKATLKALPLI